MILKFVRFLTYIKKLEIVSIENSFLHIEDFKSSVSMSKKVVHTNFTSLSPYQKSTLTYLSQNNSLFVWFIPTLEKKIFIPEAYLLYKALLSKGHRDIIAIFDLPNPSLVVIKDANLLSQTRIPKEDKLFFERLTHEYGITNIKHFTSDEHAHLLSTAYAKLSPKQWQQILSLELPKFSSFSKHIEPLYLPFAIIFLAAIGYHYALNYYLKTTLEDAQTLFQNGRGVTLPIKNELKRIEKNKENWELFLTRTLVRPDALSATLPILKVADETDTLLKYIKVSAAKAEVVVETSSATDFIKELIKTKAYENIKLEHSKTDALTNKESAKINALFKNFDTNMSH